MAFTVGGMPCPVDLLTWWGVEAWQVFVAVCVEAWEAGASVVSIVPGLGGKVQGMWPQGMVTPAPSVRDGKKEV